MDVEILESIIMPSRTRLGILLIRYGQLYMKCDLVYYKRENKIWIRMPEKWVSEVCKLRYVYWPNKELTAEFQEIALQKIYEKYDLSLDKLVYIYTDAVKSIRKNKKKKTPPEVRGARIK